MLVCALFVYAVPAAKVTITHTQKDGTVLTLRLVGDEHMHYYENVATGQAMQKAADGDFVVISPTELSTRLQQASVRRADINKHRVARLPRLSQSQKKNGPNYAIGNFDNMTGTKKGLVILVNFTDVSFTVGATSSQQGSTTTWDYTGTKTAFYNQFNQQGYSQNGHIGSVKDYFSAQSYGTFTVDFDVVGPVTVSQNMAYYGAPKDKENDSYPATMVIEACKLADAAGVDFSKYDWNGDGYVDQVFVIYAGYNQAQGGSENTIWPHEWDLFSANYFGDGTGPFKLDGKTIKTYACTSELAGYSGTTMDGIGTACHEFSHCLGYPDLYDTDGSLNGSGFGMSYYDLMAAGSYNGPNGHGEVPCGYSAYERWMAGWITPTELSADAATISGMVTIDSQTNGGTVLSGNYTLANSPSRAYIIKNGSDNDYYLLENRPNTGYFRYFRSNNSGSGLFITHVNYNATAWQKNTVNAYSDNQRFIFVPADGIFSTSSYTTDFFPTSSVTSFTYVADKQVTNITKSGGLISFDYNGGYNDEGSRYTITLDACGGSVSQTSWTQTSYKQAWTLPEPVPTVNGWYGAGWSLTKITSSTPLDNVALIDYDKPYTPESDVTLYAVYHNEDFICNSYPTNVGDGGDEPGEGEGGDITITPISGIPVGYYNSTIEGKNDRELELALKAIVMNPEKYAHISYNTLWKAYETTDVVPTALLKDPSKTDQVYDMYANLNTFTKYYSDKDHSQTGGINREHCVPNSWWGGKEGNGTAYTDLHHLVPSDGAANNAKSNHPLGEYKSGMTLSWPTETKVNTSGYTYVEADNTADYTGSWSHVWNTTSGTKVFEPADEFKGDFARMYLYVVCAYEGDLTWQTADNTMFSNNTSDHNYTVIADDAKALLLKWHRNDPVSDKERLRNNAVQSIQGNRNPFIDYPVLVEYVWGDSIAKTTFSLERMPSAYQFGVTYCVGQDVTCSEQVRLCDRGSSVTLPTATTTVEGWTFSGWTTSRIENTTTAPTLLTGSYTPTANIELYAVFEAQGTYSIAPEALEVPGGEGGAAALYFPHIAKLGQPFTAPAFNTNSNGAQTWSSSNTAVAEVDNQGHVTIKAVGTTIITVTQAETATYKQGSASYMIKVVE